MKPVSAKWRDLLKLIPGYDPFADAGDCWFDEEAAQRALDFFPECLKHIEGALAGKPFRLELFQQAKTANLFGWKKRDDRGRIVRRYREALFYEPRKQGKTPWCAGVGLYVFFCDNEPGAQCYIAAGEREQAGMLFRHCKGMVDQEPELASRCKIYGGNASAGQSKSIVKETDGSFLRVISADAETKHGGNTHLAIIDELHVQPNRELVDVLRTSMASENRAQPLLLFITTADYARESICNEVYDYACKVRDGIIKDQAFLPVIYEATRDDDWRTEEVWRKANPNLGVSVSLDYLKRECAKAVEIPAYENTFKRLHLNIITEQDERAMPMDAWDECGEPFDEASLAGRPCFAGLDMSTTTDVTAFVLLFPPQEEGEPYHVVSRFWIPKVGAHLRDRKDRVPYTAWLRDGLMTGHDGNRLLYDHVRADINRLRERFNIVDIGADRWNATQLILQLQDDGFTITPYGQGFKDMTAPMKELLAKVVAREIRHGGHPVLRWMASNLSVEQDAAGNLKPSKKKSTERIDGMVALVMALGREMATADFTSIYETPGQLAL